MKKINPPISAKLVPAKNGSKVAAPSSEQDFATGCFHRAERVLVIGETKLYWLVHGDPVRRYRKETGYASGTIGTISRKAMNFQLTFN